MPHVANDTLPIGMDVTGIGSWVRVRNAGVQDWVDRFNGRRYVIPAGGEMLVEYEALMLWMGDPDARDIDARRRYRTEEFARIRVRCGAYDDVQAWEANKPRLEAFTVDGTRIITVADDPDLSSPLLPTSGGVASEDAVAALAERVRVLQADLERALSGQTVNPAVPSPAVPSPAEAPAPFAQESTEGTPIGPLPNDDDSLPEDERPSPVTAPPAAEDPGVIVSKGASEPLPVDTPTKPKVRR